MRCSSALTHTHLFRVWYDQHCASRQTSNNNADLFSLLRVLLQSVVRVEVLNPEKRGRATLRERVCNTSAWRWCQRWSPAVLRWWLGVGAFDSVSWESVKICATSQECDECHEERKEQTLMESYNTEADLAFEKSYRLQWNGSTGTVCWTHITLVSLVWSSVLWSHLSWVWSC